MYTSLRGHFGQLNTKPGALIFIALPESFRDLSLASRAPVTPPAAPRSERAGPRLALDDGHYSEAAESFEQALAGAKKTGRAPLADLRVYAADALLRIDRGDAAEELLTTELKVFPANARARSALQSLYRSSGRAADAAALAQH